MYLIFDTETTGLYEVGMPAPRLVQLAWQLHDAQGALRNQATHIVKPEGFEIPFQATKIHGISDQRASQEGIPLAKAIEFFEHSLKEAQYLVGHNLEYDIRVLSDEYKQLNKDCRLQELPVQDIMKESTAYMALPGGKGGKYKFPKLIELYEKLFSIGFPSAHDAAFDVAATAACFFALLQKKVLNPPDETKAEDINYEAPAFFKQALTQNTSTPTAPKAKAAAVGAPPTSDTTVSGAHMKLPFAHVHVHSQHSVIPATLSVQDIVSLAKKEGLAAVALTDMGNLCGAFSFVKAAQQANILPIVGCEYFVSEKRRLQKFTRDQPDRIYRQVLLAKNEKGYQNLCQLSTLGYTEGLYGIYPRIDQALITEHKEELIALSGSMYSELPQLILHQGKKRAESALGYWMDTFGQDFYLELQRHGSEEENHINEVLLDWAQQHGLPILPVQEVFYAEESGSDTHDTLLCIRAQLLKSAPIGEGRGKRPALVQERHHFCSISEMHQRFSDVPEAFEHLAKLLEKIEPYALAKEVALPAFTLPKGFQDEGSYLAHLVQAGAQLRYQPLEEDVKKRLKYELEVINQAGYAGYFLIVHEIVSQARKMGVDVGPGRGSVAGSLVAYVLGITQVDPMAYGLLFERFLNPDRISMPDIDIDFDDENRDRLIHWVLQHYGKDRVAQISTYGTMAARSSIRDCARVLEMSLEEADQLAKKIPAKPGASLKAGLKQEPLKSLRAGKDLAAQVLAQAEVIEGTVRQAGTHACGVIIAPSSLRERVPLMKIKDAELPATQYDNSVVEEAGLLKMDFLGLRTLSILRTTLQHIKKRHHKDIQIEHIPLDDTKTYALFQQGRTAGIFQFESGGMQRYLRALKPDRFEDLIAMNALYRPGPMEHIDSFIARKHKREAIRYDLPEMEEFLAETYGITVYQEQVMQLSERLAGFSKSQADTLRYAMGKKQHSVLQKLRPQFMEGFCAQGHASKLGEKIWKDWEAFASYAFNKSHATCYSLLAYQTAYLRANYPEEYMSALLTHHQRQVEKIAFFIEECRSGGIRVMPPDVNTSQVSFSVHNKKEISFGLAAIKGVGLGAAEAICQAREKNGPFKDIFDFATRASSTAISKKTYEALAKSGAFDQFLGTHRRQYLEAPKGKKNGIEQALKWSEYSQEAVASSQESLFDDNSGLSSPQSSSLPIIDPYGKKEILDMEKETIGAYISGHPLDDLRILIPYLCNTSMHELGTPEYLPKRHSYTLIGYIVVHETHKTRHDNTYGHLIVEDYSGTHNFTLWQETYEKYKTALQPEAKLYIEGHLETRSFNPKQDTPPARTFFKVDRVLNLPEGLPKLLQNIALCIDVEKIEKTFFEHLEQLLQKSATGHCTLHMHLYDQDTLARMHLHKYKICPDIALITALQKFKGLNLKLDLASTR